MNAFDIVVLVLLLFGAIGGFRKGFLLEIIGFIALILGIFGALKLLNVGMDYIQEHFEISSQLLPYITFIILFVLIIIGVSIIGRLIKTVVHLTPLGVIDNIAGAFMGLFKWAIGISFILYVSTSFGFTFFGKTEESLLYGYIAGIAPWILEQVQFITPLVREFSDTKQA